jgi:hypothetical protein
VQAGLFSWPFVTLVAASDHNSSQTFQVLFFRHQAAPDMAPRLSVLKAILMKALRPFKKRSQRPFVELPADQQIEEERLPHYDKEQFYPVHIADVFHVSWQRKLE